MGGKAGSVFSIMHLRVHLGNIYPIILTLCEPHSAESQTKIWVNDSLRRLQSRKQQWRSHRKGCGLYVMEKSNSDNNENITSSHQEKVSFTSGSTPPVLYMLTHGESIPEREVFVTSHVA